MAIELGTATAAAGEQATGWLDATALPAGGAERLPVVVINGGSGPTAWVTAGVHGNEVVGVAVAQDLADALSPADVTGTLVIVPVCNHAGLRRRARRSYYNDADPNRGFPDPHDASVEPPSVQELIDERLYTAFTETVPADALLDLHTAGAGTLPFTIRDRVLYDDDAGGRQDDDARVLAGETAALAAAVALPVVTEYPPAAYTEKSLQRSLAGAALNAGGEAVATVVSPHGEARETVESDHDGYVLGHREGALAYEHDPVCQLVVRDEEPLVAPRADTR